jgi:hypothetical protein
LTDEERSAIRALATDLPKLKYLRGPDPEVPERLDGDAGRKRASGGDIRVHGNGAHGQQSSVSAREMDGSRCSGVRRMREEAYQSSDSRQS